MDEDDVVYEWKCPQCGWRVADIEMQSAVIDFGCGRCKTAWGEFVPVKSGFGRSSSATPGA